MIRKLFRMLLLVVAVGGLLGLASYVGARATVGQLVGNDSPLSARTITFAYNGVADLPGKPRVWVFQFDGTRLPGIRRATVYVSMGGKIVSTKPRDLAARIEAYERSLEPGP